jgi:L-ascorbate metabolism protein UlaG (beta-lactamase superfamily)
VTFLGVATVLFDDGKTQILTDGFFSRPTLWQLMAPGTRIETNYEVVQRVLQRAGIGHRLAAVIPIHSHYDHALDAPLVAQLTGAVVLGSNSTANIARGFGLPETSIRVVEHNGETFNFGDFEVTLVLSQHSARPFWPGEITEPVVPPAQVDALKMGECYSVLVRHRRLGRTILVHGSTNYVEGALKGYEAQIVFLGSVGLSSWMDSAQTKAAFREVYWHEVVETVHAQRVFPVHWDDFMSPLSESMVAMPAFVDEFAETVNDLVARGKRSNVDVRFPIVFDRIDPFQDLP